MKKLFFILFPFLFLSCKSGYFTGIYDYEYVNNSSSTVTFSIDNDKTYTLEPKQSVTVTHNNDDSYHFLNNPRVKAHKECKKQYAYYYIYIDDLDYTNMTFFNYSNYDIIITELNGLLGDKYGDFLIVEAGKTKTSKVYTSSPNFYAIFADTKMPANNVYSVSVN